MKQTLQKFVLFIIALFFGGFFLCNTVFAEEGDKGIIVESFEYNDLNELELTWSVDSGYNEFYKSYFPGSSDFDYLGFYDVGSKRFRLEIPQWGSWLLLYVKAVDCLDTDNFSKIQRADFGSKICTIRFDKIYWQYGGSERFPASGSYITKSDLDNYMGSSDFLEGLSLNFIVESPFNYEKENLSGGTYDFLSYAYYPFTYLNTFPIEGSPPEPVDAVCGSDNGQNFAYPEYWPTNLCDPGELVVPSYVFNGTGWTWTCSGLNGGQSVNCNAYNTEPVDAVCGSDNGQTLYNDPTNLCDPGELFLPSFVRTSSGWSWICGGYNGGDQSYCSATKADIIFPDMPELEDCASYTVPDKWICEIKNTITSAFLPSEDKLNQLNITINSIQGKAPFNYLISASTTINQLKNGISESPLSFSMMGNTSQVNTEALTAGFSDTFKGFITLLVVFAFIFWGLNYIKHFFK